LTQALRTIEEFVVAVRPGAVRGDEALAMIGLLARFERAAASGIALLSPVVVETGAFAKAGHASAPEWLAAVSGSSSGVAKGRLAAAERAAVSPALVGALREGELSPSELQLVTKAAASAPGAVDSLLEMKAQGAGHQELSDEAARLRCAARCAETARAQRARVHQLRHLRTHQAEGGGIRGEFFCDEVVWARVAPGLEADAKARWKAAGPQRESLDAYRLDAFVDYLAGRGSGGTARPHTLVLVDAGALQRGTAEGGELCEIDGIGPVSVEAAAELLGEGTVQFIVRSGIDIRTVTRSTRTIAQRISVALIARDRCCVVPGCGKRLGLEDDHCQVEFGKGGPTELGNLARLCGPHHSMKSHGGWRLDGGPGHWTWVAPPNAPTAGRIARERKVAVAKATRNRPNQR
jgi:hypothetical protein